MKKFLPCLAIVLFFCMCFVSCDTLSNIGIYDENQTPSNSENQTQSNSENQTQSKIEVNNIILSKSEILLGIGETASLIATISPSNAKNTLTWSSSNSEVASVDNNGIITAISGGNAVIKVEADNGILAVCNVEVRIKTGSVTGNVTYKYNNYVGNKPDTNSTVFLISKNVTSLPDSMAWGWTFGLENYDGVYATEVDGSGNYIFNNIPVGDYYIVIISENTNSGFSSGKIFWGASVYNMFSEEAKENADSTCRMHKIKSSSVKVQDEKTTTFSHDFGITTY